MLDLKDMVAFPTTAPSREQLENSIIKSNDASSSPLVRQIEKENHVDRILQKSVIRTTELDHALMDSITDSVADTIRSKDFDILRRHGQPFLEAFLRRAKVQSAHRKALKVYIKWRKRYGNPKAEMDLTEKLTRPEVSTIMRTSRVLHFCRTPLIFCDPEKEWPNLAEGSNGRAIVIEWFNNMANSLMSEYAAYLESADMQYIDFAKSDDIGYNDDFIFRTSKFSLGKHITAECAPTFLLRVFEGGSIICEVRLTGVFVSVTLYTLHRQYGRLDYNRFRHETRMKKRTNFKKFEENSGHFKQMIHINSFVYDFQLHYIQKMLDNPEKVPADLDILSFVRRFALMNQQPSPYSKDRIIHGFYQFDITDIETSTFLVTLFKYAPRYGLLNVTTNNSCSAVTVSSFDLSFNSETSIHLTHSNWKYTLVICPANDETSNMISKPQYEDTSISNINQINLEYFVLAVYQGSITPESMTQTSWVKCDNCSPSDNVLSNFALPEEGYTLADIVRNARIRIDNIVSEVYEILQYILLNPNLLHAGYY
ncbi:uncharacterized protein BX663DRAFT_433829 [Cokeromyces recurvatus]|uniref:uncharacterized protein n=1 Tax=Cokeromyces recurvatus TaxID=90255 RepID=UPI00221E50D7|nr:uncharacterized protein BX663DRAFT_433829 [Cokeromyces recurvatus]KAI7903404.1 hypothetical protein BX663DRAFT_433829 [Cokeromyces recurvatus]